MNKSLAVTVCDSTHRFRQAELEMSDTASAPTRPHRRQQPTSKLVDPTNSAKPVTTSHQKAVAEHTRLQNQHAEPTADAQDSVQPTSHNAYSARAQTSSTQTEDVQELTSDEDEILVYKSELYSWHQCHEP